MIVPSSFNVQCFYLFLNAGLYRSVDHSSATTQISIARCNALMSDTARDRSLVKRCRDLVRGRGMVDLVAYYDHASPIDPNYCEPGELRAYFPILTHPVY